MKSVVVCASKKYKNEVAEFCKELRNLGVLVFEPSISKPIFENETFGNECLTRVVFKGLTLEHFDWIRKADVCFVYNKNGYVGTSVSLEMGYATALGKPIFALEASTGDPCRDALIDKVISNSKDLIRLL